MSVLLKDFNRDTFQYFPDFEFENPLKDSWKCPVCKKLLKDPLQLGCGHRICTSCFEDLPMVSGQSKKLCPVDNEIIEEIYSDRSALLEIIKIKVYCTMKGKGCPWIGMIFYFFSHLTNCTFANSCKACNFSIIGCEVKGERDEIERHRITACSSHVALIGLAERKLLKRYDDCGVKVKQLSQSVHDINRRLDIDSDSIFATNSAVEGLHPRISNIQTGLDLESTTVYNRAKKINELENFSESYNFLKEKKDVSDQLYSLSLSLQQIEEGSNENFGVDLAQNQVAERTNVEGKLRKLEKERKNARKTLAEIDLKIRLFQATTTDGNYVWKIDNFSRRMREARENKITELYSPPLYTWIFGYKVCCKIFLNGNENEPDGFGTHVAFYAIVMRGDNDDLLKFPFPNKFIVKLLARDGNHIEKVIAPSRSHPSVKKPTEEMNPIVGYSKFVSHSELAENNFVWDDALFFKVDFTENV